MNFGWIVTYADLLLWGAGQTLLLLIISVGLGFPLAIGIALLRLGQNRVLARLADGYCTFLRGTPLLVQLWLLYYGVGSLLPMVPGLRGSILWPLLSQGFFFAALSFTLNYAAYEAEVIRGALRSVPKGEIEAARAVGMPPGMVTRRIWLPRALRTALPVIAGGVVLQLKATPLAFSVTVMDLYAVAYKVRQDTLLVYEPLLVVSLFFVVVAILINRIFRRIEAQVPIRR